MASGVRARTPGTMTVLDPGRSASPDSARPPSSGRRSITKSFSLEMRRNSLEVLKSSGREEGERRTNSAGSSGRRSVTDESYWILAETNQICEAAGRRAYVTQLPKELGTQWCPQPKERVFSKLPNRTQETVHPVHTDTSASGGTEGEVDQMDGEEEEIKQRVERLELEEGRRRECRDTSQGKSNRDVPIQQSEDPSQNAAGEAGVPQAPPTGPEEEEEEEEGSDDSDDDDDDDDESDEEIKAPFELLGEFLESVMKEEYETAQKLCQMILIYEPENPEALQFKPLIEERLQQEAEAEEESSSKLLSSHSGLLQ
ncbi:Glutamate-rich protein 2 [Branchiostoma belcheri]|nr:Glutamate-rich protein 2 [Branchiostoma belcheri]